MIEKPTTKKNKGAKLWSAFRRNWIADHPADYRGWWICSYCGEAIMHKNELELDHIEKRSVSPNLRLEESNIRPVHSTCHRKIHAN